MRILSVRIDPPQDVVARIVSDLGALARLARAVPTQLDRLLTLGEEMTAIGRTVLELGERLDAHADAITALGERLDARADAITALGERLDARADTIMGLGERIDARGAEIVERADQVVETGNDIVHALPTLEKALELATPLEGAIDRVGRFVDRLPGGAGVRRPGPGGPLDRR